MESGKKRRIKDKRRQFKESSTNDYFAIENTEKIVCLICQQVISVMKEYNVKRHYEASHEDYVAYVGEQRKEKVVKLKNALSAKQTIFKKVCKINEASTQASYIVAHEIAKNVSRSVMLNL